MNYIRIVIYACIFTILSNPNWERATAFGQFSSPANEKNTSPVLDPNTKIESTDSANRELEPPSLPGTIAEQKEYLKNIQNLLDVGLKPRPGSWEKAKGLYEATLKRGDDPRLHYAWAMACLKSMKNEEALKRSASRR